MTDRELARLERAGWPSNQRRAKRKSRLKTQYGKSYQELAAEILDTTEKLMLLIEIRAEKFPKEAL